MLRCDSDIADRLYATQQENMALRSVRIPIEFRRFELSGRTVTLDVNPINNSLV
jgi:hypothetical protein